MEKLFIDLVGNPNNGVGAAGVGDGTEGKGYFNIDDPAWEGKWDTAEYTLSIGKEEQEPKTCEQNCMETDKAREAKCDIVRKRVAYTMKKIGCPSEFTSNVPAPDHTCMEAEEEEEEDDYEYEYEEDGEDEEEEECSCQVSNPSETTSEPVKECNQEDLCSKCQAESQPVKTCCQCNGLIT